MRTKTILLSALLGALGSVSAMAQTNVYSLNAVGYINATLEPGYTILSCPLIASPDNTIATLLNNTNAQYQSGLKKAEVFQFTGGGYSAEDTAGAANAPSGWQAGGVITINPGQAVFFYNPTSSNMFATFVGTVPTGSLTNTLSPGYNLVGSIVPATGDIVTNSIMNFTNAQRLDYVYTFDSDINPATSAQFGYSEQDVFSPAAGGWTTGDPTITNVYEGFFYHVNSATVPINWVENFSVSQ